MPEQPRNFDAIGKVLRIGLVQFRATLDRKPKVQENQNTAEHVKTMKTGDQKVGRKVSAVPWRKGAWRDLRRGTFSARRRNYPPIKRSRWLRDGLLTGILRSRNELCAEGVLCACISRIRGGKF